MWPLVSRLRLQHAEALNELLTSDRDYWKSRAEQLIDQHLGKAGAIQFPTMEKRKPINDIASVGAAIASAMAVTEIDSSKKKAVS